MNYHTFASESVCAGHPDKICDQISDAIVDEAIKIEKHSRIAVETLVTENQVVIAGEVTCPQPLPFEKIARKKIQELGYTKDEYHFSDASPVTVFVHQQSPDIAVGVNTGGAGDQGMMFGYAVNETPEFMPLPIALAHALAEKMDVLKTSSLAYLRPDGKTEVTVKYENGKPVGVETIVLACPHDPVVEKTQVLDDLYLHAVLPVLESFSLSKIEKSQLILNGTGRWEIGGPSSDTGVTGRKIIVDTYGGMGRVGGGCFSGKDVTKVDRASAYATRYLAKNIVASGLAQRCEVQVAYVIGYKDPIAKAIETFGTETAPIKTIEDYAWSLLDLSVQGIVEGLDLLRPIYSKTARYGHFGHAEYPWEKLALR
ncbi:MAG: S-adenosylmethionine synthase [Microgenomates group bacterium GW2011_GWF2_45_18]|nr:MAG: S-adenosylmethionine synthase [Microgenomates group bacterium GW2011_GWF1_44_10]KKU02172.1 MAG: S-adenosylmethionine synthase [Microgenomates group bacterium GW2011_GWF2_45_18]OGJ41609.1 MAG: methionine adenosyltransferase [Candidatus Pacebacteria bacterium RIFOXYB1_FULL_44_10]HAX01852.1 methionine adenosyltransferase [Candidatus Paceibacterota bacterium]